MNQEKIVDKALALLPHFLALEVDRIRAEEEVGNAIETVDQVLGSDEEAMRRVASVCVAYVKAIDEEARQSIEGFAKKKIPLNNLCEEVPLPRRGDLEGGVYSDWVADRIAERQRYFEMAQLTAPVFGTLRFDPSVLNAPVHLSSAADRGLSLNTVSVRNATTAVNVDTGQV